MPNVRRATTDDADAIARLLYDFNVEYDTPTPEPPQLAARLRLLLTEDHMIVLLAGEGPDGVAVLRFRPSIWSTALECYLAELYVAPARRGEGLGRALMETALEAARAEGADYIDLGTSEDDTAARALYESLGFRNSEKPGGPVSYFYEREL
jgi:ribosomal protein S18 acetylase RimI-like enzyme